MFDCVLVLLLLSIVVLHVLTWTSRMLDVDLYLLGLLTSAMKARLARSHFAPGAFCYYLLDVSAKTGRSTSSRKNSKVVWNDMTVFTLLSLICLAYYFE